MMLGQVVAKKACLVGRRQQLQAVLIELAQRLGATVDPIKDPEINFTHRRHSLLLNSGTSRDLNLSDASR
jgi:hypothetical protein